MALKQLKHIVSKKKRRFQEDGFDLDLSYITDNIIAMGFPADNLEGVYRNHIDDVVRCRDRAYNSARFHDRVVCFSLDDHHPPSLPIMRPFCEDVHQWLSLNPENVAAVHCKAGKGRTGVMICAYLLYCGMFATPDEALAHYGEKRTIDKNGVTIPSQRRYVGYFGRLLRDSLEYRSVPMILKAIHFETIPTFEKSGLCNPCFVVRSHDKKLYTSLAYDMPRGARCLSMDINGDAAVSVSDDVRIDFFHRSGRIQKREKMFHMWFNTYFVCSGAGSPASIYNHNRIKPKQSDPGNRPDAVYRRSCQINGNGCGNERKDSVVSSDSCTGAVASSRPSRCHSTPNSVDSIYNCHHVLTLMKNDLDVAHKDKACKKFPANFKVHIVLQCADVSHCPLTSQRRDVHLKTFEHSPADTGFIDTQVRRTERVPEEVIEEDEVSSSDTDEEEEEDDDATGNVDMQLVTAAFCQLCRSTEALDKSGAETSGDARLATISESMGADGQGTDRHGLLTPPDQNWPSRRSSSPK